MHLSRVLVITDSDVIAPILIHRFHVFIPQTSCSLGWRPHIVLRSVFQASKVKTSPVLKQMPKKTLPTVYYIESGEQSIHALSTKFYVERVFKRIWKIIPKHIRGVIISVLKTVCWPFLNWDPLWIWENDFVSYPRLAQKSLVQKDLLLWPCCYGQYWYYCKKQLLQETKIHIYMYITKFKLRPFFISPLSYLHIHALKNKNTLICLTSESILNCPIVINNEPKQTTLFSIRSLSPCYSYV